MPALIRIISELLITVAIQFCAAIWLKATIFFRASVLKRSGAAEFPDLSAVRVIAAIIVSAVYALSMRSSFDGALRTANLILLSLVQIAVTLDIWAEIIPIELLCVMAGVAFLNPISLNRTALLQGISMSITAAFLFSVSLICVRIVGRKAFSDGDILFCAVYSGVFGFSDGLSAFGLGLAFVGIFAIIGQRWLGSKRTIPLVPFICIAHVAIRACEISLI